MDQEFDVHEKQVILQTSTNTSVPAQLSYHKSFTIKTKLLGTLVLTQVLFMLSKIHLTLFIILDFGFGFFWMC